MTKLTERFSPTIVIFTFCVIMGMYNNYFKMFLGEILTVSIVVLILLLILSGRVVVIITGIFTIILFLLLFVKLLEILRTPSSIIGSIL